MKKHLLLGASGLIVYSGFIFFLSSIPASEVPSALSSFDKLIHFFLYVVLGLIFTYFLNNLGVSLTQVIVGVATFFFIAVYGLTDEIHQTFTPGRNFDLLDILADVLGGIGGWLLFWFLTAKNRGS